MRTDRQCTAVSKVQEHCQLSRHFFVHMHSMHAITHMHTKLYIACSSSILFLEYFFLAILGRNSIKPGGFGQGHR